MRKGSMLLTIAALLTACGGTAGQLTQDDIVYAFEAQVVVSTQNPEPGRRVDFAVELVSVGNSPVICDVTLRVVSDTGDEIYVQRWEEMRFVPDNEWNLQNGFLPSTDVERSYRVSVEVRRHDTGELLYLQPEASRLVFG